MLDERARAVRTRCVLDVSDFSYYFQLLINCADEITHYRTEIGDV